MHAANKSDDFRRDDVITQNVVEMSKERTKSKALSQNAAIAHVFLVLKVGQVNGTREDENVGEVHEPRHQSNRLLHRQSL